MVEAEAVNSFWDSRSRGKLRKRAEKLAQEILGLFARAKLEGRGAAIREAVCGIGLVDVVIMFSSGLLHVVELKVLRSQGIPGVAQLRKYMALKGRREGWLVLFDARRPGRKTKVPSLFNSKTSTVRTIMIDINPVPPHQLT